MALVTTRRADRAGVRPIALVAALAGLVSLLALDASAQQTVPSGADLAALLPARLGASPRGDVSTYMRFVTAEYPMRDRRRSSLQLHEVLGAGSEAFQRRDCPRSITVARRRACLRVNERLASVSWVLDDAIQVIVSAPDEASVMPLARTLDLTPFARAAARAPREPSPESAGVVGGAVITAAPSAPNAAPSAAPRPRVVSLPPPAYPSEARARQLEGVVRVRVQIATDGALADATVVSGDPVLADAALASVRAARFEAARGADGRPVAASTIVSVRFVLD